MAHYDYDCCAICDRELAYKGAPSAETKEELCETCVENILATNTCEPSIEAILNYMKSLSDVDALKWLHAINYEPCYYDNPFDDFFIELGLVLTKQPEGKWGKKLKSLPAG